MTSTALTAPEKSKASQLTLAPREAKVMFLYGLCCSMRVQRGTTVRDLALIWGVSDATVGSMLREAKAELAKNIQATVGTPEEMVHELLGELEFIKMDAMQAKKGILNKDGDVVYVDAPDRRAAIAAIEKSVELLALGAGKGHRNNPYGDKSKEELAALAKKLIGELREAKDEIPTEGTEVVDVEHEAEAVPVVPQLDGRVHANEPLGGGSGRRGENRGPRTRSSDLVHPRPGPPDSSPKRVRKNPQAQGGER